MLGRRSATNRMYSKSDQKNVLKDKVTGEVLAVSLPKYSQEEALLKASKEGVLIYGQCINGFCEPVDSFDVTTYNTQASLVQILGGEEAISATRCAEGRQGYLCGQCKTGYSLTMYYTVSGRVQVPW